eukprot:GFKZ01004238.1.p1 GENE.GFKZ01004238.1~~GFKZ01004238.1.p1  ORF type:complete len:109 (-),score=2.53 GFKZ01004238.1:353-679(-)
MFGHPENRSVHMRSRKLQHYEALIGGFQKAPCSHAKDDLPHREQTAVEPPASRWIPIRFPLMLKLLVEIEHENSLVPYVYFCQFPPLDCVQQLPLSSPKTGEPGGYCE